MNPQIAFLLNGAIECIQSSNFATAQLYLNQLLKLQPSNHDGLRLMGVIEALNENYTLAEKYLISAIKAAPKNGIAYSNLGNVLKKLGREEEAISSYNKAIKLNNKYSEAYSNRGTLLNEMGSYEDALTDLQQAVALDNTNSIAHFNLGNYLKQHKRYYESYDSYVKAIQINKSFSDARENLGHLLLLSFNFKEGWQNYDYRWFASQFASPPLITSKPKWTGAKSKSRLFVWSEQGIGDQILYSSMLHELSEFPQRNIISIDEKLLPIFRRSFPHFEFINKADSISEDLYEEQIPLASLGGFFRNSLEDFHKAHHPYIVDDAARTQSIKSRPEFTNKVTCGISWGSINKKVGDDKSIPIHNLYSILKMNNIEFVNLQYGDIKGTLLRVQEEIGKRILNLDEVDLFEDVDGALSIISACDIIVTSSNSTAHLAGALGKETLLLIPYSVGQFWYWHAIDGKSVWYPSVRVFEQGQQGDWSAPVGAVKQYLESRFG